MKKLCFIMAAVFLVALGVLFLLRFRTDDRTHLSIIQDEEALLNPDEIIVYCEGKKMSARQDDEIYQSICVLLKPDVTGGILETAIEDEEVEAHRQKRRAVEYVFNNEQIMGGRSYTHIFFFLSSPYKGEMALGDEESFFSGTYYFTYDEQELDQVTSFQ